MIQKPIQKTNRLFNTKMMKKMIIAAIATAALSTTAMAQNNNFDYSVDRFADIEVLRYQVPGFEDL